jgi:hypothetical protein
METLMPDTMRTGGCLCGAVRYEITAEPDYAGLCYCADCQKVSGSAFVGVVGVPASGFKVTGEASRYVCKALGGGDAVRNSCPTCHSLLFGGIVGQDTSHTVYVGGLDDGSWFAPSFAIFASRRPAWAPEPPPGVAVFAEMPPGR